MAVIPHLDFVLKGKKEKKKREKKSGKELLQIGEPEEQLSFFEELEQEVSSKDPSLLTFCGMPWLRCQCVKSAALAGSRRGDQLRLLDCCKSAQCFAHGSCWVSFLHAHGILCGAQKGATPTLDISSFPRMPVRDDDPDLGPGESPLWDLLTSMRTGALQ